MYQVQHYHPRCVLWGREQLSRPTTSFARGCKLWSRERQFYEEERYSNMAQFSDRPYLYRQYPEIGKHYPGTWRVVHSQELEDIVERLVQPTKATSSRADHIREHTTHFRLVHSREKAKDMIFRTRSAVPRLEGGHSSTCSSRMGWAPPRNGTSGTKPAAPGQRKCQETSWSLAHESSTNIASATLSPISDQTLTPV